MSYAHPQFLETVSGLRQRLDDPQTVIVDCAWDRAAFTRAHIPGARFRPGHAYVKDPTPEGDAGLLLSNAEAFAQTLASLGIQRDSRVVLYDASGSIFAARAWWALRYFGFDQAQVLNGGWQAWLQADLPVRTGAELPAEKSVPMQLEAMPERIARYDAVASAGAELQIVDCRREEEHYGQELAGNARGGHIPGATHLRWTHLMRGGSDADAVREVLPLEQLHDMFGCAGLDRSRTPVTYCQAGVRAAYVAFVLELAGFPTPRVYDGSMAEWANRPDAALA